MHMKPLANLVACLLVVCMCSANVPVASAAIMASSSDGPRETGTHVSVGARMGGETMAEMLGLDTTGMVMTRAGMSDDITADDALDNPKLYAFGSDANQNPDPYFYNYVYNLRADSASRTTNAIATTMNYSEGPARLVTEWDNSGTTVDLVHRPDILLGTLGGTLTQADVKFVEGGSNATHFKTWGDFKLFVATIRSWTGNANLAGRMNSDGNRYTKSEFYKSGDEGYDPEGVAYDGSSFNAMVDTTYALSDAAESAMTAKSLKTRYELRPSQIAFQYERYVKALKWYVLSKIADGSVARQTVAVVYRVNADGTFRLAVLNRDGDSSSLGAQRVAEAAQDTVTDLAGTLFPAAKAGGLVDVSAAQLMSADAIICENGSAIGGQMASRENIARSLKQGGYVDESAYPRILDDGVPTGTSGMTSTSQATESAQVIGLVQGFLYPSLFDSANLLRYFFESFYHLDSSSVDHMVELTCKNVSYIEEQAKHGGETYSKDSVETLLQKGEDYFYAHASQVSKTRPKIAASSRYDAASGHVALEGARIAPIGAQTCTGKALAPALSITVKSGSSAKALIAGADYTAKYSNNVKPGVANVSIEGIGSCYGSASTTFSITLAKPSGVKVAKGKSKKLKASWKKVAGASKYRVEYRVRGSSSWKKSSTTTKPSLTLKKLSKGKRYQVRVVAIAGACTSTSNTVTSSKVA